MLQSTNYPLSTYSLQSYRGWEEISKKVEELGVDGLEVIADPDNLADDIPPDLVAEYQSCYYIGYPSAVYTL